VRGSVADRQLSHGVRHELVVNREAAVIRAAFLELAHDPSPPAVTSQRDGQSSQSRVERAWQASGPRPAWALTVFLSPTALASALIRNSQ